MTNTDLDGKWGIFVGSKNIPVERWDSFRTKFVQEMNIGHNSHICPGRSKRPVEWITNKEYSNIFSGLDNDAFCRIVTGKEPAIVITEDEKVVDEPYSINFGLKNYQYCIAITFINLYASTGRRILTSADRSDGGQPLSLGIPLVHTLTKHYSCIEEVPANQLTMFLKNTALSQVLSETAIKRKYGSEAPVQILHFYNIGSSAGATIPHLHAQSWIYLKKGRGWKDHGFIEAFENHKSLSNDSYYCLGCAYARDVEKDALGQELNIRERRIYKNEHWQVVTEFAPERDGHLRILPLRHFSRINDATEPEYFSLADALIVANRALSLFASEYGNKSFNIQKDRNILFRQQNGCHSSGFHLIVDIIPVQSTGGAELYDDHRISHVFPEETAKKMRELLRDA
ncbi:MAG: hypothetical protein ACFFD4_38265 [Candidatus Odinarchaeota archaeon]